MYLGSVTSTAALLLGPHGWFLLGPRLADGERVWFDPQDCSAHVSAVDIRGEEPGMDLGRTWGRGGWSFVHDTTQALGDTVVTSDNKGRILSFVAAGRRTTVVREEGGTFLGLARGSVTVIRRSTRPAMDSTNHIAGTEDLWSGSGEAADYRWEAGNLASVGSTRGLTRYTYTSGTLSGIATAEGGGATLAPGLIRANGVDWRCTTDRGVTVIDAGAEKWRVEGSRSAGEQRVVDPSGGVTASRWVEGRLIGWTHPGGGVTEVRWGDDHTLDTVSSASGTWSMRWANGALTALSGATTWTMAYDAAGNLTQQVDGLSRLTPWLSAGGAVLQWGSGAGRRLLARGAQGVSAITDGGRVTLARDADGRLIGATDPAGGEWRLVRDAAGHVTEVADPGGARWHLSWDAVGRIAAVTDPAGRESRWDRTPAGVMTFAVDGAAWQFGRDDRGRVTTAEDPQGRRWRVSRDALGRPIALTRPDQSTLRFERDAAGDIVGIDDFHITRDAAGWPVAWSRGSRSGGWARDPSGWNGVRGPGVRFKLTRNAAGEVAAVELDGGPRWTLDRDADGRVIAVDGPGAVTITRDSSGRVTALAGPSGDLRIDRDGRGLPARVQLTQGTTTRRWIWRRDGAGRILGVDAPGGLQFGVDRDTSGRPQLARFSDGSLARYLWDTSGVGIMLQGADDALLAVSGWSVDGLGRVTRLRGENPVLLQRDPLGVLTVQEGTDVWSRAPDRMEGPNGAALTWGSGQRAAEGRIPTGAPPLWGIADGAVSWSYGEDGAVAGVLGALGSITLAHDALGRLVRWATTRADATETTEIVRDALGRLVSVGGAEALGWDAELAFAGAPRATVPDVGQARPGGGVLVDGRGVPILAAPIGEVRVAPSGLPSTSATGELGSGGRFQPLVGGPLLGRLDAIDPMSGQPTSAPWPLPGEEEVWEVTRAETPWPEPDASSDVPWDPARWAPEAPWADPLSLLVEAGMLPEGGPRALPPPGLPWLPDSAAPVLPAPVRDPAAVDLHLGIVESWVYAHARAPVQPAPPDSLVRWLLSQEADPDASPSGHARAGDGSTGSGSDPITSTLLFATSNTRY